MSYFCKEPSDKYMLSGAFLIFSKMMLQRYDEPFDPRTFMYYEESFLRLRCEDSHLPMVYDPDFEVLHTHGMSVKKISLNELGSMEFWLKEGLKSLALYRKELERRSHYSIIDHIRDSKVISNRDSSIIKQLNGKSVVIYGAGIAGTELYEKLSAAKKIRVVGWVDNKIKKDYHYDPRVEFTSKISELQFDYLVVAVRNKDLYEQIRYEVTEKYNISPAKMIWIER